MLRRMSQALDRNDPTPLHLQVRRALLALIADLRLKPGDRLPAETVLWDRFRVSRSTLRQAVDALVRDNVLYRQHPKGTFVGHGAVEGDLQVLRSIWEDIRRLGMEPAARQVGARRVLAPEISPLVAVAPDQPMLELQRVFTADGEPIAFDTAYFPLPEFEWLGREDLEASWYDHLAARGITLSHARTTIDATRASGQVAALLGVDAGEALLCLRRQTFTRNDSPGGQRPIAFTSALFRAGCYQFSVVLSRR